MIYSIKEVISAKISGEWGKEGTEEDGVKVIRTSNFVNDGTIDYTDVVFRDIVENKVERKKLYYGDIIIEKSGGSPNQPVGRVVFFDLKTYEPYLCNNFTTVLRPNKNLIYPEYLFYHLFYLYQNGKTKKYQNKTTGIINLKLDDYLEEKLFVPGFEKQIQICSGLRKTKKVIQNRRQSLKQLDDFVDSVFYQLFGDPVRNERGWETELLKDLCTKIGSGATPRGGKENYKQKGISLVRSLNVYNGRFEYKGLAFIDDEQARALNNVIVEENDVLFTITGASVARCCVVPKDILPARVNQHVAIIRVDKKKINSVFLNYTLINLNYQTLLIRLARQNGATREALTKEEVELLRIPLPPLSLQNRFAEIVRKTQGIKQRFQESLEELNNLYQSLSQRAFQGKLDLSRFDVQEEGEKFQRRPDVSAKESVENLLLRDNSAFNDAPIAREQEEKSYQTRSVLSDVVNVRRPAYGVFNLEQIAERIKARYKGYHFSFEMLYRYLQKNLDDVPYYSSEELKKRPELNSEQDIRWFIQAAIVNIKRGENEKRLLNPFIRLEQHFYNAEEENMSLHIIDEDYELLQNRNKKERSGIYFSIAES